ncbi:hypothetical protein HDV02_003539 [Globomyces sp. JEL0801]|nr:hypothetical protein HDV02_003539 [Globomyces sp. JEL0801]
MSMDRKKEIDQKRERLNQIRQAKLARGESSSSFASIPSISASSKEVEDLVNSLIGPHGQETWRSSLSYQTSQVSLADEDVLPPQKQIVKEPPKELVLNSVVMVDYVPEEKLMYSKEIQTETIALAVESEQNYSPKSLTPISEIKPDHFALEVVESNTAPEISEEQKIELILSDEFVQFFDRSAKIMERALNEDYDYLIDYTAAVGKTDTFETKDMRLFRTFAHERWTKNRSVTDIDWSTRYPELILGSYNKNSANISESDGLILVWNYHLAERPEFILHAQVTFLSINKKSEIMTAKFSPFHPSLIVGGTYSGHISIWDTRAKNTPILSTSLSSPGHSHPVYSICIVGTQNAHNLITSSTDGVVCSWQLDLLANPQELTELVVPPSFSRTDEGIINSDDVDLIVSVTTLNFQKSDTTTYWIGSESGKVYQANRFDRAGSKAGIDSSIIYEGHQSSITGMDFHPSASAEFSNLLLTSSVDWSVKLWKSQASKSGQLTSIQPLKSFEEADDYITDVSWSPTHPAMFASVDGSGHLDLYNLNHSDVPISRQTAPNMRGFNKVKWDRSGKKTMDSLSTPERRIQTLPMPSTQPNISTSRDHQEVAHIRAIQGNFQPTTARLRQAAAQALARTHQSRMGRVISPMGPRTHNGTINPSVHPQFRSKAVCGLSCNHCESNLCDRGMRAILLGNTTIELFSTDIPPFGVALVDKDYFTKNCS